MVSRQFLDLIKFIFLRVYHSLKPYILFHSNHLASFPDVTHIKANSGLKVAIFNLIELRFCRAYPSLKPHILFYCNGRVIWHGSSDIAHIKVEYGQ